MHLVLTTTRYVNKLQCAECIQKLLEKTMLPYTSVYHA